MTKTLLALATALTTTILPTTAKDRQHDADSFEWKPELSTKGPIIVAVSLKSQTASVYRNGIQIGKCEISAGKRGHETPTGIFHILNKDKDHHSKTYGNAPMPYSERLTWGGVALHAGSLPGYPSSHGCIHLPYEFSKKLFGITHKGTTVVVTNRAPDVHISHDHSFFVRPGQKPIEVPFSWTPEKSPSGPLSLVYSEADKKLTVLRNGIIIGETAVSAGFFKDRPKGTVAFVCTGWDMTPREPVSQWVGVGGNRSHHAKSLTNWFDLNPAFKRLLDPVVTQGTNLVITSESVTKHTRSNPGFTVLQGTLVEKAEKK